VLPPSHSRACAGYRLTATPQPVDFRLGGESAAAEPLCCATKRKACARKVCGTAFRADGPLAVGSPPRGATTPDGMVTSCVEPAEPAASGDRRGGTIMTMPDISPEQRREIERLVAEHGGELTEEIVLEAARSPDSYLHSLFEWDDAKAARKHRESWADEQRS
jgi:hypothetical protein